MNKELDQMIARFPAYRMQIIQLFTNSSNFKSLCEDYWICRKAIERHKVNQEQQSEYSELCFELENEALSYFRQP